MTPEEARVVGEASSEEHVVAASVGIAAAFCDVATQEGGKPCVACIEAAHGAVEILLEMGWTPPDAGLAFPLQAMMVLGAITIAQGGAITAKPPPDGTEGYLDVRIDSDKVSARWIAGAPAGSA